MACHPSIHLNRKEYLEGLRSLSKQASLICVLVFFIVFQIGTIMEAFILEKSCFLERRGCGQVLFNSLF